MSDARRSDGLLSAEVILYLVQLVQAGHDDAKELSSTLRVMQSASLARTSNTLAILAEIGVLESAEGRVRVAAAFTQPCDLREALRRSIFGRYCALLELAELGSAFQLREGGKELWVDRLQLPFRDLGFPYLLIQFDLARRSNPEERFWRISNDVKEDLLSLLAKANSTPPKQRRFPLAHLKRLLAAQELAGREAEEFVVNFEKRRLARHPFKKLVRSISDEDAGAGYDILSFETEFTLIHDRLIEVKSYAADSSFFWSADEIGTAREMANRYWLYLVDRSMMHSQGYAPEMLQDPYTYFLVHKPEGWFVEQKILKFTRSPARESAGET